jgi:hypothetical protein
MEGNLSAPPCHKPHVYCQSTALLMQFLLSELLVAYPEVRTLEGLQGHLKPRLGTSRLTDHVLSCLASSLSSLTGSVVEEAHPLPWTRHQGSLGKFKQYCELYPSIDGLLAPVIADLKMAAQKALHSVWLARELVRQIRSSDDDQRRRQDIAAVSEQLVQLATNMSCAAQCVAALLPHHHRDENVLFFVLRHHLAFDELYYPNFVLHHLSLTFSNGMTEVEAYLTQRFAARGFDHVIPVIRRLRDAATC